VVVRSEVQSYGIDWASIGGKSHGVILLLGLSICMTKNYSQNVLQRNCSVIGFDSIYLIKEKYPTLPTLVTPETRGNADGMGLFCRGLGVASPLKPIPEPTPCLLRCPAEKCRLPTEKCRLPTEKSRLPTERPKLSG